MIKRLFLFLLSAFLVTGCATALGPVSYKGQVTHQSDLAGRVLLNTGEVTGYSAQSMMYVNGMFIPISTGPMPKLQFGSEDQHVFLQSLKNELVRTGVLKSISENTGKDNLEITVNFAHTEHFPQFQEYKFTVLLLLHCGDKSDSKTYEIMSSDGDSIWAKMNTNALQGKTKAAEKLMVAMIPDIENFAANIRK